MEAKTAKRMIAQIVHARYPSPVVTRPFHCMKMSIWKGRATSGSNILTISSTPYQPTSSGVGLKLGRAARTGMTDRINVQRFPAKNSKPSFLRSCSSLAIDINSIRRCSSCSGTDNSAKLFVAWSIGDRFFSIRCGPTLLCQGGAATPPAVCHFDG